MQYGGRRVFHVFAIAHSGAMAASFDPAYVSLMMGRDVHQQHSANSSFRPRSMAVDPGMGSLEPPNAQLEGRQVDK